MKILIKWTQRDFYKEKENGQKEIEVDSIREIRGFVNQAGVKEFGIKTWDGVYFIEDKETIKLIMKHFLGVE
jgi:hypothetical protein